MIGLGSNRLTVCRRGGMSVTQAGRGGMEWLAGGRMPSWASPYSAQATAAIIKAFPSTFPTMLQYGKDNPDIVPYVNENPMIVEYCVLYPTFSEWVLRYDLHHFETPRLAIDANDAYDERKWLIRSAHNYTDWYDLNNVFTQTDFAYVLAGITPTNNYVSKVGNTSYGTGTIVKFFIPTTMPIGWSEWFADGLDVRLNDTQILYTTSYHNSRKDVAYDFSNLIRLNRVNHIILRWWGSGNHGFDFGLRG